MARITYLLGAGASCGALPIVNEMHEKIQDTIIWFTGIYNQIYPFYISNGSQTIRNPDRRPQNDEELKRITSDLNWLKEICNTKRNFSVDTYARKLDISEKLDDYVKLKNVLSFYFTLEQRRNLPDVRYDNFWASILKSRTEFPDNIKIISWNYDFQLELTYQDFFGHDSLSVARETLNVSSHESEPSDLKNPEKFGVFKLNGSATFNTNSIENYRTSYFIDNFKSLAIKDFIPKLIETYENLCTKQTYKNHLKFAWQHTMDSPFFVHLKNAIQDTNILVVIGYSFPFFNRETDKYILKDSMTKLNKVYFQAPDAENLKERFLAIRDDIDEKKLVIRKDKGQFVLPNEL